MNQLISGKNIRRSILIPLGFTLLFIFIVLVIGSYHFQQGRLRDDVHAQTLRTEELFSIFLERESALLEGQIDLLVDNPSLQEAFIQRDAEALDQASAPIFQNMNSKYKITHFYFHDLDRVVFFRAHDPPRNGDTVNRATLVNSEETQATDSGIELGKLGQFTLRVVEPWIVDGELIGYLELGMEIEHLTTLLHDILDPHLILTIEKQYLTEESWQRGLANLGRSGDWDLFEEFVIIDQTYDTLPATLPDAITEFTQNQDIIFVELAFEQRNLNMTRFPLVDKGKGAIGYAYIVHDMTDQVTTSRNTTFGISIFVFFAGGILFGFFFFYIGRVETAQKAITDELNEASKEIEKQAVAEYKNNQILRETIATYLGFIQHVSEGDFSTRLDIDQIGQGSAEESFKNLRQLGTSLNAMAQTLQLTMGSQVAKETLEKIIGHYMDFVSQVAQGDLSTTLSLNGEYKDDLEQNKDLLELGRNLNEMVRNLREMTLGVRKTVEGISAASAEIQSVSTQQAANAAQQDHTVNETVSTLERLWAVVDETAQRASAVTEASHETVSITQVGQQAAAESIEGMRAVQQRVADIAENILLLSEKTQQIGEIIDTVNSLADQSKLLALNASIEAARAGEEGKGFAVVAMEVRQLADQSREATARVRDILGEIQQATNSAVMVTEEGSKVAESGAGLVERAQGTIEELAQVLANAAEMSSQISSSTDQQAAGMNQLLEAMQQIIQSTAQTTASTQQAERSIQNLIETAKELEEATARYQI